MSTGGCGISLDRDSASKAFQSRIVLEKKYLYTSVYVMSRLFNNGVRTGELSRIGLTTRTFIDAYFETPRLWDTQYVN